jgi:hypothetical protein
MWWMACRMTGCMSLPSIFSLKWPNKNRPDWFEKWLNRVFR